MSVRRSLAALGALVLLTGCGGDPEPKVEETPTSPTTSPRQSERAKPATAEDVIRQYVELSLKAQNTGATAEFADAFPECRQCLKQVQLIERAYARGGYIESGTWVIKDIQVAGHIGARYEYNLIADADPGRFLPKNGGQVRRYPGGKTELRLVLMRGPQGWSLTDIQAM